MKKRIPHRRIQPSATDGLWCVSSIDSRNDKIRAYADRLTREQADMLLAVRTITSFEKRLHAWRSQGHQ